MRILLSITLLLCTLTHCKATDEKAYAKAELSNVTVYRLGAELMQHFSLNTKPQTQFIEVTNISNSMEKYSLQIKTNSNITILGFEYFNNYLSTEAKTSEYLKIEDSLNKINKEITKQNSNLATLKDLLNVLNSNKEIKGTQTGLSVIELMKLMDYYKIKSTELKGQISELDEKVEKLNETKNKLSNQLNEEKKVEMQKGGKLVIQIICNIGGNYEFTLNYLTQNASWTPFYDIKTKNTNSPFDLEYKAKVAQSTGIDWKQIHLKLSTALPNQFGNAPILKTWFLQYTDPRINLRGKSSYLADSKPSAALSEVVVVGYGSRHRNDDDGIRDMNIEPIYIVNGTITAKEDFKKITPQAIKSINVLKTDAATSLYGSKASAGAIEVTLKDELSDYVTIQDNTLTTEYDIDLPFDITTNGKEKVASLLTKQVEAAYTFYSIPKLNDNVYLVAKIPNWSKLNLLNGDANLFFENTFIGKTEINASAVQDTFDLTIVTDKRILIKREKLKDFSSTQFLSSYKKEVFTYEITVKNNKSVTAAINIRDQFPICSTKEIEVELLESTAAAANTETGELNWSISLQPNEQKKIRFSYSIKYPKDKKLNL